jgi:Flp pilus assembly protein TadD
MDDAAARARAHYDAEEYDQSLAVAREGLGAAPDDVELLVLAGRAGIEVDDAGATAHLRRATELAPDDPAPWRHLGEALAADGLTEQAADAFRRALELDPDDQVALSNLGHTSLAAGRNEEGVDFLARAADTSHGASTAAISLVDMYRTFGRNDEALTQARLVAEAAPDDPFAWLDVAELSLAVGKVDDARGAYDRLRELDDMPGQESRVAAAESGEEPKPAGEISEAELSAWLAEYRRQHADEIRQTPGGFLG